MPGIPRQRYYLCAIKTSTVMIFSDFESFLSSKRLARYSNGTGGDKNKALYLYRLNVRLSQEMYGLFGIFEVVLRNAIDSHYGTQFSDADWLLNQCGSRGMFSDRTLARNGFTTRTIILDSHRKLGTTYNHDALLSSLSFGTWSYLFAAREFRAGGQTLHRIFPARPRGTNSTILFNDLERLRLFRNRIAHHEPVVFNATGIHTAYAKMIHQNLCEKTQWLDIQPNELFYGLDHCNKWLRFIDCI